jgi:glycosyltransferase involved in cell wall biosynthesis
MSYYPNADGVLWYLRDIWPRVKDQVNNAQCYLVGAHPSAAVQAYDGKQDVHITGRVPDVHDYLKKAWVYVVPLRIGGGIRLKILEAMASGRAIVSTAVGCEGLDVHPGRDLLQEDAPNAFADAVIALLQNHAKRDSIRKNARALAEAHYDWDRVIPSQQSLYCSLSKQRPSPS